MIYSQSPQEAKDLADIQSLENLIQSLEQLYQRKPFGNLQIAQLCGAKQLLESMLSAWVYDHNTTLEIETMV